MAIRQAAPRSHIVDCEHSRRRAPNAGKVTLAVAWSLVRIATEARLPGSNVAIASTQAPSSTLCFAAWCCSVGKTSQARQCDISFASLCPDTCKPGVLDLRLVLRRSPWGRQSALRSGDSPQTCFMPLQARDPCPEKLRFSLAKEA